MSVLKMIGTPRLDSETLAILGSKTTKRKRTIVVGLKSHNCSREMLLRLLTVVVLPGDTVLAIHVEESVDTFDPNSFHIHEDLCKSKQVDFLVKVCTGGSFIAVLTQQVILHFASILVLGCSSPRPKESVVSCLQDLPPTCFLLVMNNSGCILLQQNGAPQYMPMNRSLLSHISYANDEHHLPKALPVLVSSRSLPTNAGIGLKKVMNTMQFLNTKIQKQFQQVAPLESMGASRRFSQRELERATDKFSPLMVIGHSRHSIVYKGNLKDGQVAAVKVLKITNLSREELLQEVNILSGLNHEHIVHLIGYCYSKDIQAVVYNLLQGSLKQNLKSLQWKERMNVAVGVAKALQYLHRSCSPPIIHRDVKSSNILLSHHFCPQLSDFGTAMVNHQPQKSLATREQLHVVGTFGYMAPEYVMYGKVNEKTDVYSYGVVLLELITGKPAIQKNMEFKQGSLVLWARSLLGRGLSEQLIDPNLNEDYNNEEMQRMMTAAQLCLRDSSSRRPSITKIIKLLEEPQYWVKVRKEREECTDEFKSSREPRLQRCED